MAYEKLQMNSYDVPVAEGFDRLVIDGKMNEAAEYLAQSTGAETAFLFGCRIIRMDGAPTSGGSQATSVRGQCGIATSSHVSLDVVRLLKGRLRWDDSLVLRLQLDSQGRH
jgi:hypothetical protein